jgi:hypothetical protein
MDNQQTLAVGITQTNELLRFLGQLANATDVSLADGKINYWDLANFLALIPSVGPAVDGIKEVPRELANLEPGERAILNTTLATALRLSNPLTDDLVKQGFDTALHLAQFFAAVRAAKAAQAAF